MYYYIRWKILSIFHTRLLFDIVLGEVIVFLLFVGGLAAALGVIGDEGEGTGAIATYPGVSNRWKSMIGKPIDQSISIDKIS